MFKTLLNIQILGVGEEVMRFVHGIPYGYRIKDFFPNFYNLSQRLPNSIINSYQAVRHFSTFYSTFVFGACPKGESQCYYKKVSIILIVTHHMSSLFKSSISMVQEVYVGMPKEGFLLSLPKEMDLTTGSVLSLTFRT